MFRLLAVAALGFFLVSFAADADAQRRLGGGKNLGRQAPQLQQRQATPPAAQPPAAAPATRAPGAPSPMRNLLLGAAAGIGLAALASWMGFGEEMAMFLLVAVVAMMAMAAFGLLMRRRSPQPAAATIGGYGVGGPGYGPAGPSASSPTTQQVPTATRSPLEAATWNPPSRAARPGSAMDEFMGASPLAGAVAPWGVPDDFDTAAFLAQARSYFERLQAAWDGARLETLADFTTQEMFTALTHELRGRTGAPAATRVETLDVQLLGIETGERDYVASVRFTGALDVDGDREPLDEVWNLSKPRDGSSGWLLAGIQQLA